MTGRRIAIAAMAVMLVGCGSPRPESLQGEVCKSIATAGRSPYPWPDIYQSVIDAQANLAPVPAGGGLVAAAHGCTTPGGTTPAADDAHSFGFGRRRVGGLLGRVPRRLGREQCGAAPQVRCGDGRAEKDPVERALLYQGFRAKPDQTGRA